MNDGIVQIQAVGGGVDLHVIQGSHRKPAGDSSIYDGIEYGCFLTQFDLSFVGISVAVGIVGGTRIQMAELIEFGPVHDSVSVVVSVTGNPMGDDFRGFGYSQVDFATRKPGRSTLPDSVDRPVGKVIAIA